MLKSYLYDLATDRRSSGLDRVVKGVLYGLSRIYFLAVTAKAAMYQKNIQKAQSLPCPVISVGNLTWGGTGKTPFVILLSRIVRELKHNPFVLTRGYAGEEASDEVLMLKAKCHAPVVVGANRLAGGRDFLKENSADCAILDDGYQHIQLKRDLNILLVDCLNPFGNGQLMPRGILREPLTAIKRADIIVLSKVNLCHEARVLELHRIIKPHNLCPVLETAHIPSGLVDLRNDEKLDLKHLSGKGVLAVSAIGAPASFEHSIKECGSTINKHFIYPDHGAYTAQVINALNRYCLDTKIATLVTTAKDAVKLKNFIKLFDTKISLVVLEIESRPIKGKDVLLARVSDLLSR